MEALKAWLLVILIFGEPAYESPPMTQEACNEAKVEIFDQADKRAASGEPFYFSGRKVERSDVKVDCLPAPKDA